MEDVENFNQYEELKLFTDFVMKIRNVENALPKDIVPGERKDVPGKTVNG